MKIKRWQMWLVIVGASLCFIALSLFGCLWQLYEEAEKHNVQSFLDGKTDRLEGWDYAGTGINAK